MKSSIVKIQNQIIEEFNSLDNDMEMVNYYIIELGEKLQPISNEEKTDDNLIKGCQSKVWISAVLNSEKIQYSADSNSLITKGLASLLVRIFSNQTPKDVIEASLFFPEKIGMNKFIGTQRNNGFASMFQQMKYYALAYQSKRVK